MGTAAVAVGRPPCAPCAVLSLCAGTDRCSGLLSPVVVLGVAVGGLGSWVVRGWVVGVRGYDLTRAT